MLYLEARCFKCGTNNEIYTKPHEKLQTFSCISCRSGKLILKVAHDLSAKAVMVGLKHLEERLDALESAFREVGFEEVEFEVESVDKRDVN